MFTGKQLCERIVSLYPDIGTCGIDVHVEADEQKKVWLIKLKKGDKELLHYLEQPDADTCMEGKQCVSLGLEIAQLKKNIEEKQF